MKWSTVFLVLAIYVLLILAAQREQPLIVFSLTVEKREEGKNGGLDKDVPAIRPDVPSVADYRREGTEEESPAV